MPTGFTSPRSFWRTCWGCAASASPAPPAICSRRGLIRYHRGEITVLDRAGLEAAACSCYASDRLAYKRRFG